MVKEQKIILDSSVWISYFIKEDVFHYESIRLINKLLRTGYKVLLPAIVFYEVINVILRKTEDIAELNKIMELLKLRDEIVFIEILKDDLLQHLINLAQRFTLKTSDLIILSYCDRIKPTIFFTYDKKLLEAYKNC